jgi:hypothetical protein
MAAVFGTESTQTLPPALFLPERLNNDVQYQPDKNQHYTLYGYNKDFRRQQSKDLKQERKTDGNPKQNNHELHNRVTLREAGDTILQELP